MLAVSFSVLVLVLVDGLMSFIGFFSGFVCPVRLLIVIQYFGSGLRPLLFGQLFSLLLIGFLFPL